MAPAEGLLGALDRLPPEDRASPHVREVLSGILELHGAGLARMMDALRRSGGDAAARDVAADEVVSSLLLLHGLHPVGPEERVRGALEALRKSLEAMRASARLVSLRDGIARVVVQQRDARSAPAAAVDEALCAAAPDVTVEIERDVETPTDSLVPVERLRPRSAPRAATPGDDRCELCGAEVGAGHDHLADPRARELACACVACASLFAGESRGRWRRVRHQALPLSEFAMSDAIWERLGIPIDLAFFYRSSVADRVVAYYPSPAGATESLLSLEAWTDLEAENGVLRELALDVEALLVRRRRDGESLFYRASIDVCYALVGEIRKHWRGLGGGAAVWEHIDAFFDRLARAPEEAPCAR